jgi:hypothetical protein
VIRYKGKIEWVAEFERAIKFACSFLCIDYSTIKIEFAFLPATNGVQNNGFFFHTGNKPIKIQIEKALNKNAAIMAAFHELVHWQQCIREAYKEGDFSWFGVKYCQPKNYTEYLNLPWEKEAREVAIKIAQKFWAMNS